MKNNELNKNNIENGNKRLKINESEIDNGSLNIIENTFIKVGSICRKH